MMTFCLCLTTEMADHVTVYNSFRLFWLLTGMKEHWHDTLCFRIKSLEPVYLLDLRKDRFWRRPMYICGIGCSMAGFLVQLLFCWFNFYFAGQRLEKHCLSLVKFQATEIIAAYIPSICTLILIFSDRVHLFLLALRRVLRVKFKSSVALAVLDWSMTVLRFALSMLLLLYFLLYYVPCTFICPLPSLSVPH